MLVKANFVPGDRTAEHAAGDRELLACHAALPRFAYLERELPGRTWADDFQRVDDGEAQTFPEVGFPRSMRKRISQVLSKPNQAIVDIRGPVVEAPAN